MFTKLTISQRIQIGLVLAMAFLLVLGSNRLDQRHFSNIQTTVNSVYKDRVVVQNIIYQLSTIFHDREQQLMLKDSFIPKVSENKKVTQLLSDFRATKLTPKESNLLGTLMTQFSRLQELEYSLKETPISMSADRRMAMVKKFEEIRFSLDGLSHIQLEESELLTQLSNKSLGMNILLSKLEVAFLVIIGIAMLVLIFNPMNTLHAFNGNPSHN